jgi:hypothetical protein
VFNIIILKENLNRNRSFTVPSSRIGEKTITIRVYAGEEFKIQNYQLTDEIQENIWAGRLLADYPDKPLTNTDIIKRKRRERGWESI